MSRHSFYGPHWPGPKDVLTASPQEITTTAAAYQHGVIHRQEKGQPVPKMQMRESVSEQESVPVIRWLPFGWTARETEKPELEAGG